MPLLQKSTSVSLFYIFYCGILFRLMFHYSPYLISTLCFLIGFIAAFICVGILSFKYTRKAYCCQKINPKNKAVIITGCDRGFGHFLTKRLLSKGYYVFAGCLFPYQADVQELQSEYPDLLHILELDVTNEESVKKTFDFVQKYLNELELWAVVNNAGILKGFHAEFSNIKEYRDSIEVNCLGVIRVTMTFLPLLKKSRGRIINVTSMSGRSAVTTVSPYVTSKYAAVGFNDCLRHEMNAWGIRVICIEPDYFRTKLITEEGMEREIDTMVKSLPSQIREDYGKDFFTGFKNSRRAILRSASSDHRKVIDDMENAISHVYPEDAYRPCGLLQSIPYIWFYESFSPTFQNMFMKLCLLGSVKPKTLK